MTRRSHTVVAAAAMASALTLGGCGSDSLHAATSASSRTAASSRAAASSQAGASSRAAASSQAGAATAATAPLLVLAPDGLGVASGASIRRLPFGTDLATVTTALASTVGPVTRTPQPECGPGPRVQVGGRGFSALFDGTRFVGWLDSGRTTPRLTTAEGVGVGSTLRAIRASFAGVKVTTASLGPEWSTPDGAIGGLLDGTTASSRMTDFYAGETCFFR